MIIYLIDKNEIDGFKHAGQEAARMLNLIVSKAKPGTTTLELDQVIREECDKIHATPTFLNYRGFPAAICASINDILVHGIPDNTPLKADDILSLDVGITIDGCIGDTATTIMIDQYNLKWTDNTYAWPFLYGEPKLLVSCKDALNCCIREAKAGNKLSDIIKMIYNLAQGNKFLVPRLFGGHGISKNKLHGAPYIPNDPSELSEDVVLVPGMVLAIEPMFIDAQSDKLTILADGWSVKAEGKTSHFEHTILITEEWPVILTEAQPTTSTSGFTGPTGFTGLTHDDLLALKGQVGKWK